MARDVERYLERYCDHFCLGPHFRLGVTVQRVTAIVFGEAESVERWRLDLEEAPAEEFDKVVMATGPQAVPVMPRFEGQEQFEGTMIHSRAFKRCVVSPATPHISSPLSCFILFPLSPFFSSDLCWANVLPLPFPRGRPGLVLIAEAPDRTRSMACGFSLSAWEIRQRTWQICWSDGPPASRFPIGEAPW